jgi:hypothetical protein
MEMQLVAWKQNRFDNPNLNHEQADGIAADIAVARKTLDRLEDACRRGEHPNRLKDYVNEVNRMMCFAASFCDQAARHCDERAEKARRINANASLTPSR